MDNKLVPLIISEHYCRYQVDGEPEILHVVIGVNEDAYYCMWEDPHDCVKMERLGAKELKERYDIDILGSGNTDQRLQLQIAVFGAGISAEQESNYCVHVDLINRGNPLLPEFRKWFRAVDNSDPSTYKEDIDFEDGQGKGKYIGCWVSRISSEKEEHPHAVIHYDYKQYNDEQ